MGLQPLSPPTALGPDRFAFPTGISVNPTGARKCCKTTLVHDDFDVIFDVLTSFSRQFLPNVSTSTYKRGAVLNFSYSKNVVILA